MKIGEEKEMEIKIKCSIYLSFFSLYVTWICLRRKFHQTKTKVHHLVFKIVWILLHGQIIVSSSRYLIIGCQKKQSNTLLCHQKLIDTENIWLLIFLSMKIFIWVIFCVWFACFHLWLVASETGSKCHFELPS